MRYDNRVAAVIPALNEERSIAKVLADIPEWFDVRIVVDNGSTDDTAKLAHAAGATVVSQPERGYGAACLAGIEHVRQREGFTAGDIIVFLDADYSDHPEQAEWLVDPIAQGHRDLVIGSRVQKAASGSLTVPQRFGNWLATTLIRLIWRMRFSDLGPFRAVSIGALDRMAMADRNYGWTVEMQIKAAMLRLRCSEVDVDYRPRIGTSKVSGTVRGTVLAGYKILYTIARYGVLPPRGLREGAGAPHAVRPVRAPGERHRDPKTASQITAE